MNDAELNQEVIESDLFEAGVGAAAGVLITDIISESGIQEEMGIDEDALTLGIATTAGALSTLDAGGVIDFSKEPNLIWGGVASSIFAVETLDLATQM